MLSLEEYLKKEIHIFLSSLKNKEKWQIVKWQLQSLKEKDWDILFLFLFRVWEEEDGKDPRLNEVSFEEGAHSAYPRHWKGENSSWIWLGVARLLESFLLIF